MRTMVGLLWAALFAFGCGGNVVIDGAGNQDEPGKPSDPGPDNPTVPDNPTGPTEPTDPGPSGPQPPQPPEELQPECYDGEPLSCSSGGEPSPSRI